MDRVHGPRVQGLNALAGTYGPTHVGIAMSFAPSPSHPPLGGSPSTNLMGAMTLRHTHIRGRILHNHTPAVGAGIEATARRGNLQRLIAKGALISTSTSPPLMKQKEMTIMVRKAT